MKLYVIALVVVCLLVFIVYTDFQMGPTVYKEPLKGTPIMINDVVVDSILFNPHFDTKNRNGVIMDFYKKQFDRKADVSDKISLQHDNIATLNVHKFEPINLKYSIGDCIGAVFQLMDKFNICVMALQEVPLSRLDDFQHILESEGFYHTIDDFDESFRRFSFREPITNVVISKHPITVEKKLLLKTEDANIWKHRHAIFFKVGCPKYLGKLFCATHLECNIYSDNKLVSDNMVSRKLQIKDIFNYGQAGPDIIMGDLNLLPDSPEYLLLATRYSDSGNKERYTIPLYTGEPMTVDYIWHKDKIQVESYDVNYLWSDHRPVVGIVT